MDRITACEVPEGSLLAEFGGLGDYRDCFCREVDDAVDLGTFIERFYCSTAFRPERLVLGLMGRGASNADARALARGETDRIAVWEVVERRSAQSGPQGRPPARSDATEGRVGEESLRGRMAPPASEAKTNRLDEILLLSGGTGTASWLAVEPLTGTGRTRLLFGTWVGNPQRPIMLALYRLHRLYSRMLLGGV